MKKHFFYILSALVVFVVSCNTSTVDEPKEPVDFFFNITIYASDNPSLQGGDIVFTSDDQVNYSGEQGMPNDLTSLKAYFSTSAAEVYIGSTLQKSRITLNDFSQEVEYNFVMDDGSTRTARVNIADFVGLPTVYVVTNGGVEIVSKDDYVSAKVWIDSDVEDFPSFSSTTVNIKGRGNSTWWMFPKKPYKLKFDSKVSLGGMPEDKTWALIANYSDKTALRAALAFAMSDLTAMEYTPRYRFVNLILNDEYVGMYQLMELRKISDGRVNLSDDGYLLEIDQLDRLEADDVYFTTPSVLVNIKDSDDVEYGTPEYEWIKDFVNEAEEVLYSDNFKDPEDGYAKYFDLECLVDWYLVNELSRNVDAQFYSSCFFNVEKGGKIKMGPVWDFDLAFGNCNYSDCFLTDGFHIKFAPWYARLFEDPAFVSLVQQRFEVFKANEAQLLALVDSMGEELADAQDKNDEVWQTLGEYVWPNYKWFNTYQEEIDYMKGWFTERCDWFEGAISEL